MGSKEGGIRGGLGSKGEAQVRNGEGEVGVGEGQVRKIVRDVAVDLRGLRRANGHVSCEVREGWSWLAEVAVGAPEMTKREGHLRSEVRERREG